MSRAQPERRCGTCVHWRPMPERDAHMDRHYGSCAAPLPPGLPACFDRSLGGRWGTAHSAGFGCEAWTGGGEHGALQ